MWFTALTLYRLHEAPGLETISADSFEETLAEMATRPLGGSEAARLGWTPPAGRHAELLVHELNGHRLFSALRQERLLPAGVVREEVEERVAEREAQEGRPVSRKEKQAIKEQVYEELLPRAFVRSQRIDVWWDTTRGLIGVNTGTRKRAEEVLDLLRQTLGSLKVTPLATQTLPVRGMTEWLNDAGGRPRWMRIGDRVELKAQGDDGVVRGRQVDLDSEEMQQLLAGGRQATQLAFEDDGCAIYVLHDDLTIKSLRFDDALLDEANDSDDGDDAILRLETDFVLMARALGSMVDQLVEALGGEAEQIPSTLETRPDDAPPGVRNSAPGFDEVADPLLDQVTAAVIAERKPLITFIQRKFKLGYNRAARLLEAMEAAGVVSAMDNQGRRKVIGGAS